MLKRKNYHENKLSRYNLNVYWKRYFYIKEKQGM